MKDFLASTTLGLILLFAMLGKTNTTFAFIPSVDNLYSNVTDTVPTQESKVMELEEKQKKWIYKHLKYPKEAQDNNIQGRVIVRFFVKTDGSISDVEAVRVIKSMPKFKPTTQNCKPVNGTYVMTVPFQLF